MEGSAFILKQTGEWACSNDVVMDEYLTPIREDNKIVRLQKSGVLKINGLFGDLQQGDKVSCVMLSDGNKYGFFGEVKSVSLQTIINIFAKTDKISEILSNITFEN